MWIKITQHPLNGLPLVEKVKPIKGMSFAKMEISTLGEVVVIALMQLFYSNRHGTNLSVNNTVCPININYC